MAIMRFDFAFAPSILNGWGPAALEQAQQIHNNCNRRRNRDAANSWDNCREPEEKGQYPDSLFTEEMVVLRLKTVSRTNHNFTVTTAALMHEDGRVLFTQGVAKRNPNDPNDWQVGRMLSAKRALDPREWMLLGSSNGFTEVSRDA